MKVSQTWTNIRPDKLMTAFTGLGYRLIEPSADNDTNNYSSVGQLPKRGLLSMLRKFNYLFR